MGDRSASRGGGLRGVCALSLAVALLGTGAALAALAGPLPRVSQKGRAFQPGFVLLKRGDTIEVVNDDGDLLHHAYVDAPGFSFDSGDQEPGGRAQITFPVAGTFQVLCGIHPKMKLAVRVEER